MLHLLYLLLEGLAVIVPTLLAVAFIDLFLEKYFKFSIIEYNLFYCFLLLILLTIFNSFLFSLLFGNAQFYNFFISLDLNTIFLIIKKMFEIWINALLIFIVSCKNILKYTLTFHSNTILTSIIPIFSKNNTFIRKSSSAPPKNYSNINPWFITGFTDGEGSFFFSVCKSINNKIGWQIAIGFNLVAKNNPANVAMFNQIQQFFGFGKIIYAKDNSFIRFIVNGVPNCLLLRNHFHNFPLLTYKLVHFQLWSDVLDIMASKEHLTLAGLLKIIAIKVHFPLGLSANLIAAFPNFKSIICPEYNPNLINLNIHWLAGFMNADASFGLHIEQASLCRFRIQITQHIRSLILLEAIQKFIGYGKISTNSKSIANLKINSLEGVNSFLFKFQDAQLLGAKALDYNDFKQGIELINNREHLTEAGKNKFAALVKGMNSTRTFFGS